MKTYNEVFTFSHLYRSYIKCRRNVGWKTSVKNYKRHSITEISKLYLQLRNGTYKPKKPAIFKIRERGKERTISSIPISQRVPEKCYCEYFLIPLLSKSLIYDNGATIKGKGTRFTIKRLKHKLISFKTGWYLILDFHNYFESIDHTILFFYIRKKILDDKLYKFYVDSVSQMSGLNLGSQLSQISAVWYCYKFDETCQKISYEYGRYMDDSYLLFKTKQQITEAYPHILKIVRELNITINPKKIKIGKIENGVPFLKRTFFPNGKVAPNNKTFIRMRRKLKKLKGKQNTYASYLGWRSSILKDDAFNKILKMDKLYVTIINNKGAK